MSDIKAEQSERLLEQTPSNSDDQDAPARRPFCIPNLSEVRPRRRLFNACAISLILLFLGFGFCRYILPKQSICTDCPKFDFSAFYGIPMNLPVIDSAAIINKTELDMKTGFVVSSTPQVREYTLNVTQALTSPDGYQKPMILLNGQMPGPLIEANSGDILRIHVNNLMSNWSTSVHWHGMDQKNTTWMDGVAAVSQCGIPPGQNFTYEFSTKGQRGTFWYHSHLSVQYTDGMFGPLIIHDPTEMVPKVDEEKLVFMSDWYHTYGSVVVASYLNPTSRWVQGESGVEPLADNLLMNGRNVYNCSVVSSTFPPGFDGQPIYPCTGGELYSTKVNSGKKYRLRLINHSSFFSFWFSVDNHTLEIVEIDGVEIQPIEFRGVNVNIGQRYSVILHANQTVGNYYMRASFPTSCFLPFVPYNSSGLESTGYQVRAILSYDDTPVTDAPIGVAGNTTNPYHVENNPFNNLVWEGCEDMPFDMPKPMRAKKAFDVSPNNYQYIEYAFRQSQNENRIFVNKTSWAPLENNATIWKTVGQNFSKGNNGYSSWAYNLDQEVLLIPDAGKGAQLVINSMDAMEHPWHMHGHEVQIVGWGSGKYGVPGATVWNLENPMRRDTISIPAGGHVVVRWEADNPGLWVLHCHVAWHMEGGMLIQFLERPSDLDNLISEMDYQTRLHTLSFCGVYDDQAFGTEVHYYPEDMAPISFGAPLSEHQKIEKLKKYYRDREMLGVN
ncbi:hypothetical protein TWF730_011268 [Orbilia blumenaviensis]|uniref:Laccase n=1 Tax=Orbilia blumenaviensis TaxID=1796055 RepID=A0AAV9UNI3_9PEZI